MADGRYKGRIVLLAGTIALLFTAVGVRLSFLFLRPADWVLKPIAAGWTIKQKRIGHRGRIVDRTGQILAMDVAAYHVYVDPRYIAEHGKPALVSECLAREFHVPRAKVDAALARTNRRYVVVFRYVPVHRLKRFERRALGVLYKPPGEEEGIYLKGVGLEEAPVRSYPKGPLMAHVIGFANRLGQGSAGIEQEMDEFLRGREGVRVSRRDARHREIYSTRIVDIAPRDGATVELALDQQIQYVTERAVEKMCREFHARAGWAVVQDVRTGEILAMASYPSFDPNRYWKAPKEWLRNRAIAFNYEPGSVMKAAVVAAALEHGIVKEDDLIDCENGYWVYGGKALRDAHGMGVITVADVIKHSSNIGAAKIALRMGADLLYRSLRGFHFGRKLGIDLPGEENGIFFSPKHWSKISITRIAMGHEIGVTALQVLAMMDAVANDGALMRPLVVRKVVAPDGTVLRRFEPEVLGRPISPRTARRMRRLLVRVTEEGGTGTKARVPGYTVAGKTGTAQKIRPRSEGGGYYSKRFISSFVGFLPAENPRIGIIVVADDPGTYTSSGRKIKYYGGTVCAPVFREIAEFAVRYLGIPPGRKREYVLENEP